MTRLWALSALCILTCSACTDVSNSGTSEAEADAQTAPNTTLDTQSEARAPEEDSVASQRPSNDAQEAMEDTDAVGGESARSPDDASIAPAGDVSSASDAGPVPTDPQSDTATPTDTTGAEDTQGEDDVEDANATCQPQCQGKACGDDGCGGSCGSCPVGESCEDGVCACEPQCEDTQCGDDGCGGECGLCPGGESCNAGQCACTPICQGKACGDDGCGGLCGTCPEGQACSDWQCECAPQCEGKSCGDDGCGGLCGTCPEGQGCSNGQCTCTPQCAGKACGDDGCGGSCGGCDDANPCTADYCTAEQTCEVSELALMPCPSPPCAVNNHCLYDLPRHLLNANERIAAISAQGVLAQHRPAIWLGGGQASPIHRARLVNDFGVNFVEESSLWSLLERFQDALSGYVLYDPNTSSQSVALSLSGILGSVAISPELEGQAQAAGLQLVEDVRGLDEAWCWDTYGAQFSDTMLAEQLESSGHAEWLMDWPISQRAFIYFDETCGDLRTELAAQLDHPLIYGWGADCGEYEFAKGASEGGGSVVASDFSSNLSVLARVEGAPVTGNTSVGNPQVEEGVHYVAFLMSDGDNIQFLQNAFDHERWWGSPERGNFEMNWEVSPILPQVAPSILTWLYETATDLDSAVAGPSGAGYAFPSLHSDALALAAATGNAMAESDMRVVTILDSQGGLEAGDAFVAQPNISGVIYKDFADYNAFGQKLRWAYGKPIMSIRYLLWNNGAYEDSPQGVAEGLNTSPKNPTTDIRSYSIVNAHAWSEWPGSPTGTGAMGAVAWTVSLLDSDVRVVSAETLFKLLSDNLQGVTEAGGAQIYEAESDLAHIMGYPDGEGWACNTADQEPGHMCYGPYTSLIEPGPRSADFHMMVDINGPPAVNDKVATIDVFDSANQTLLAARELSRYEFNGPMSYQTFSLPFTNPEGSVLEFRVYWHGTSYVNVDKVVVQ